MGWVKKNTASIVIVLILQMIDETDPKPGIIESEVCPNGLYGVNCSVKCPDNCQGNCNRHTGVCFGCKKKGQYAERCDQFCGHCNNNSCYFFNGRCHLGINMTYLHDMYNLSTTTVPNHGSVVKTDTLTESHTWCFIITILSIVIIFLIIIILVFLFGFTCMPKFLSSCFPAWYPKGGLVGLRRDHIERSRVEGQHLPC